jgi:hypothetical protein
VREGTLEAAPRLDRSADDDELGAALVRDSRDLHAKQSGACADDLTPHADAIRRSDRRGGVEPLAQDAKLSVEARVEGQLALDEERSDENDPRMAIRGEPAREIECVLRLLPREQRHDDRAVTDRARATRQPPRAPMKEAKVGASHRTSG